LTRGAQSADQAFAVKNVAAQAAIRAETNDVYRANLTRPIGWLVYQLECGRLVRDRDDQALHIAHHSGRFEQRRQSG
jgi:hypothetical protein